MSPEEAAANLKKLMELPIANVEDKELKFQDIFMKDIVVLGLLRHFG